MDEKTVLESIRLYQCSKMLRGVFLYDVGTDHCILPIYAVKNCGVPHACASDVVDGPVNHAKREVENACLTDKIDVIKADGLNGIELAIPSDVVIAGMGGELIKTIIAKKSELKNKNVRLILQPMTKKAELREYLLTEGFEIKQETTCYEGRYYTVICAEWTEKGDTYSCGELEVGKKELQTDVSSYTEYCLEKIAEIEKITNGKKLGGIDVSTEEKIIADIRKIIEK